MREFVVYDGNKYFLQSSSRYYQCGNKTIKPRLLHRKIWSDHFGEIPKGFVIHHKDHDWRNNDISNLELVELKQHLRDHAKELRNNKEWVDRTKAGLKKAQIASLKWHSSMDGLKWHREHAKQSWQYRKKEMIKCVICHVECERYFKNRKNVRFCSKSCAQKEAYKRYFTDTRACLLCKNEFLTNKHRKTQYCSRNCSNKHRFSK